MQIRYFGAELGMRFEKITVLQKNNLGIFWKIPMKEFDFIEVSSFTSSFTLQRTIPRNVLPSFQASHTPCPLWLVTLW